VLFNVMPLSVDKPGDSLHRFSGFSASATQCRPVSSGTVQLQSADPTLAPRIVSNYLRDSQDVRVLVAGLRQLREIYEQPAFRGLVTGEEYFPGNGVIGDKALEAFARERGGTVYHPVSTCRMGRDAESAVVDPQLRVFGIEGLRVADASVFPNVTSGNTNGPTIMLAHKAADSILQTS
jgi:choline dehydrogenase